MRKFPPCSAARQPRNRATAQPRNKRRNTFCRQSAFRWHSARNVCPVDGARKISPNVPGSDFLLPQNAPHGVAGIFRLPPTGANDVGRLFRLPKIAPHDVRPDFLLPQNTRRHFRGIFGSRKLLPTTFGRFFCSKKLLKGTFKAFISSRLRQTPRLECVDTSALWNEATSRRTPNLAYFKFSRFLTSDRRERQRSLATLVRMRICVCECWSID
jgi:hypothetical protein